MTRLRNSPAQGLEGPKGRTFRIRETLSELRYGHTRKQLKSVERSLETLDGKRTTYELLAKSSKASVVDEDERNWDEAMKSAAIYSSCRRALKSESRVAAIEIFSKAMFKVVLPLAASLLFLRVAMPGMSMLVAGAIVSLFALGSLVKTWISVSHGGQDFLDLVSASLEEQRLSLLSQRQRLVRKQHGWKG